ncbi:MAG: VanZ family protein [Clostridiales bacterium]|nr:VanZ family protein [Clostridiales bacterium]
MNLRKLLWIFPISWMGVIFYFSHQPGLESAHVSGWMTRIVDSIAHIFNINTSDVDLHLLVRKGAHLTEYAILGILLFVALCFTRRRLLSSTIIAFIIGAVYGVLDEFHQYYIPGRSCQISDMMIDASGVLLAVLLCSLYFVLRRFSMLLRGRNL